MWHNQTSRFLKRYLSIKYQSALVLSLTFIFLFLLLLRTPWLESHTEQLFIETTGSIVLCWENFKTRLQTIKDLYYPTAAHQELIKRLEKENAWLRHQAIELASLREAKKSLEKILRIVPYQQSDNFCTAPVLTSPLNGWNRMFLIGAGKAHGIKRGQPVISVDGVVGRIDSVSTHFSRVMPLTHQHFRIPVIGMKTRVQAILAGNGSENPSLIYLEDDHPFLHKEVFMSSIQGGGFPQGHFVGQLTYTKDTQSRFQTFIPWNQLEFVHVFLDFPLLEEKEIKNTQALSTSSTKVLP